MWKCGRSCDGAGACGEAASENRRGFLAGCCTPRSRIGFVRLSGIGIAIEEIAHRSWPLSCFAAVNSADDLPLAVEKLEGELNR